jgi:Gamma-butyrobetaine hydroxylase-like, N-terminal/ParB-like nuclease domain
MNDLQVCWWDIDKVIPYARNSRKIPQRAIDKVAASIQEFGWRQPIVVDKDFVVICGHTRLLAAKKLGLKQVPVHVADNLTPALKMVSVEPVGNYAIRILWSDGHGSGIYSFEHLRKISPESKP